MLKPLLTASLLLLSAAASAQSTAPPFQWSVSAGSIAADEGRGIVTDAQRNSYVTGFFRGTATFGSGTQQVQLTSTPPATGTAQPTDVFLAKYSPTGTLEWARRGGGAGNDEALGIAIDPQGNLLVVGTFTGTATFGSGASAATLTSAGADDVFLLKYDPNGDVLWSRRLGGPSTSAENGYAVATDSAGNVAITGDFRDQATVTGGASPITLAGTGTGSDMFVAKYNPAGTLQWVRRGSGTGTIDAGRAVAFDRAGNVIVTGSFRDRVSFEGGTGSTPLALRSRASSDLFVIKYTPEGNPIWLRLGTGGVPASGRTPSPEIGRAIATDRRKNIYLLTSIFGQAYFLTSTGDSLLVSIPPDNGDDVALVKYSAAGTVEWARVDGGESIEEALALTTDASNNVYALSYFQALAQYGPTGTGATFDSRGGWDVAVASYSTTGTFRWAQRMGGPSNDIGYGINIDAGNNLLLTGYFTGGPFTAGTNQFPLATQPSNVRDIFIAKTQALPTATRAVRAGARPLQLYPNPATSSVRLETQGGHATAYTLLDNLGRRLRTGAVAAAGAVVPLAGLPTGRYTVLVEWADGQRSTAPLMVLP